MTNRSRKATTAVALLLIFSVLQISLQASLAGPNAKSLDTVTTPAQTDNLSGTLSVRGQQPIRVNGNNATTGTTIFSGSSLETPLGVSAIVNLGALGSLELKTGTVAKLDFSEVSIKVMLTKGCVVLRTKKNTTGVVENSSGVIGTTNKEKDDELDVCQPEGSAPLIGTAAATSGGISTTTGVVLGAIGIAALITVVLINPCDRATDSSPIAPGAQNGQCL